MDTIHDASIDSWAREIIRLKGLSSLQITFRFVTVTYFLKLLNNYVFYNKTHKIINMIRYLMNLDSF